MNHKEKKKIAVLIPCWNEEKTIGKVIRDFKEHLPEATIYVYDNNSSDRTAEIAIQEGAVLRHEYRQGKGNVIRTMFREVWADCYLMVDGDDTYPAEHAREMCDLVLSGRADMVIGDRLSTTYFQENKRRFHNFGNLLMQKSIQTLWMNPDRKSPLDVMTGYRAFSPLFVKSFPVLSHGFEIETEMTIHALEHNLLLCSVPVSYRDRPQGSYSKLSTYKDGMKVIWMMLNLFRSYCPMKFFGLIAGFLFICSVILFLPIMETYLATGFVPRFPTLIVSSMMMLSSILSLVCGLILDTNVMQERKAFEIHLNLLHMQIFGSGSMLNSNDSKIKG